MQGDSTVRTFTYKFTPMWDVPNISCGAAQQLNLKRIAVPPAVMDVMPKNASFPYRIILVRAIVYPLVGAGTCMTSTALGGLCYSCWFEWNVNPELGIGGTVHGLHSLFGEFGLVVAAIGGVTVGGVFFFLSALATLVDRRRFRLGNYSGSYRKAVDTFFILTLIVSGILWSSYGLVTMCGFCDKGCAPSSCGG